MKINSILSDLISITSFAPSDISHDDLDKLGEILKKAEAADKISYSFSIKSVKMIFELKSAYSQILREKIGEDPDTAYFLKLLNSILISIKKREFSETAAILFEVQKEEKVLKKKRTMSPFVKNLKYDNIYLRFVSLIKTAGEMSLIISEEKL
ncbi:MAG: hypothetical protein GX447_07040 [Elusimicrobia bacterium]|nr:hypothetical protein [Elusimicrobiota bacterium]